MAARNCIMRLASAAPLAVLLGMLAVGYTAELPAASAPTPYVPAHFDLSALPSYQPEQLAVGVLRIYGTPLEGLVGRWAEAFRGHQGHVRLHAYLINTSQGFAGLVTGQADIGLMGHRTWHTALKAFE